MHEKRYAGGVARLRSAERMERLEVSRVASLCLEETPLQSVLDVGAGSGLFAERFAGHGLEVVGLDASHEMVTAARGLVPQAAFLEALAEALPFASGQFDLVFLGLVLHESDDPLAVLREAARVSRHRLCILEWPHRRETSGPPVTDRLSKEDMDRLGAQAGLPRWEAIPLTNVILYRASTQKGQPLF